MKIKFANTIHYSEVLHRNVTDEIFTAERIGSRVVVTVPVDNWLSNAKTLDGKPIYMQEIQIYLSDSSVIEI